MLVGEIILNPPIRRFADAVKKIQTTVTSNRVNKKTLVEDNRIVVIVSIISSISIDIIIVIVRYLH